MPEKTKQQHLKLFILVKLFVYPVTKDFIQTAIADSQSVEMQLC